MKPHSINKKKYSILIPTRERCDTLFHTIQTCVSQQYDNLEIIVSDNQSGDDTEEVVRSFKDERIRYIKTDKRLGMASNWEFAVSNATGDYITVLGDDDGMIYDAVENADKLLSIIDSPALVWNKAQYCWPSHPFFPNLLSIPLENTLFRMNTKLVLGLFLRNILSYERLPVIYSGFISRNKIKKIKNETGKFFMSVTPDVYSGISLSSAIDEYIYSLRPFSINGGSGHSNGTSVFASANKKNAKLFFEEMDIPLSKNINIIPGVVHSYVMEALYQANDHCFNGKLKINERVACKKIFKELQGKSKDVYSKGVKMLQHMTGYKEYVEKYMKKFPNYPVRISKENQIKNKLTNRNSFTLDASKFKMQNVYDVSKFVSKFVGQPEKESALKKFKYNHVILSWIRWRINELLLSKTL